ncbi:RNA 2',3'-cyclic phosphodiesterase, partial [Methylogaea oryzae]
MARIGAKTPCRTPFDVSDARGPLPESEAATARLFFALWPDDGLRETLVKTLRPLRKTATARWVRPEHYHLTLVFLGAVPVACLDRLMALAAPLPFAPFELEFQRVEFWPRPRVL